MELNYGRNRILLLWVCGILMQFARGTEARRRDLLFDLGEDDSRTIYDPRVVTCEGEFSIWFVVL